MKFLLILAVPLLGLCYVAWHVWTILPFSAVWKGLVVGLGICSFLLLFMNFGQGFDRMPLPLARALYEVGTSSLFVFLYLILIFLVLDIGRLAHRVPKAWLYENGVVATTIAVLLCCIFLYGNIHYKNKVRVALDISTEKPIARPYKVIMVSDLHLGYHNPRKELARWIDLFNAERPDLVLIAGDIIDISIRPLLEEGMAEEFRRLQAPVYACLGNHEYYSQTPRAQAFCRDAGIRVLRDESASIDNHFAVIGRDDRTNLRRKSVQELAKGIAADTTFTILLDHQPYNLEDAERASIDFQLSGHTHRGQVWPVSWITDAMYECSWGSHQRGRTRYYVSSGIGIWGGKFRIGTQSEYVVATIH